jgi:outer membrane protein
MSKVYKFLLLTSLLCPASGLLAASKVAVVDTSQILANYPKAQKVLKEIANSEKSLNKKIAAKRKQLKDARGKNKTETELQMIAQQIKTELEPEAKKLEAESKAKTEEIELDVKSVIKKVAKEKDYQLVLVKDAVLYGGDDISKEVLGKLK